MVLQDAASSKAKFLYFASLFIALVVIIAWFQPDRTGELIDTDEPLTAIRALLYHQGFRLHEQVWSDQPPLLSVIFSWTLYLWPPSLEVGRSIVTAFGALLATSLAFIVYTQRGLAASLAATVLLLASGRFLRLSGALMVGLPALSFATLSMALLAASNAKRRTLLVASGFAFACGLGTKLFVALLIPAFAAFFCVEAGKDYKPTRSLTKALAPGAIWGATVILAVVSMAMMFAPALLHGYAHQLFAGHEKMRHGFQGDQLSLLIDLSREDLYIFALAALGACFCALRMQSECIVPVVWFLVTVQFLRTHHPVWIHHYLLYSIPATWLASLAISELFCARKAYSSSPEKKIRKDVLVILRCYVLLPLLCAVTVWSVACLPTRLASKKENLAKIRIGINENLLRRIGALKPAITWMVSDSPIYAFLNNIRVVPELGLIPRKRIESGELSTQQIVSLVKQYGPEVILIHRFPELRSSLFPLLRESYVPDKRFKQLLIRRDIAQKDW